MKAPMHATADLMSLTVEGPSELGFHPYRYMCDRTDVHSEVGQRVSLCFPPLQAAVVAIFSESGHLLRVDQIHFIRC